MGAFITLGQQLVDQEALQDQLIRGRWQDFKQDVKDGKDATITVGDRAIRRGDIEVARPTQKRRGDGEKTPEFENIGIGKPLSIEILTMYTGDKPGRRTADLLAVSAVKSVDTYDAAPRAINQLVGSVSDKQLLEPSALASGSAIIYYSPALINDTVLVSFELIADSFRDSLFQQVGGLFSAAAGLPIFAPASSVLMAGSFILGAVESLGKALFETDPFLKQNIPLRFDTPDFPISLARHMVLCNDRNSRELGSYNVGVNRSMGGWRAELVDSDGNAYRGAAPYIIASFDGRERKSLKNFTPTLASAAMMERFYKAKDVSGTAIGVLKDALTFYNDFRYQGKAKDLINDLKTMDPADPKLAETRNLIEAYIKNIQTDDLKIDMPA